MHEDRFTFNRGAIRPMECLTGAWQLIKRDYWLFLGIAFVGHLVAGLAPFGILLGPALCGIHLCLLRQAHGQRVSFDMLFQGFNYFGQSLIATLFLMAPMLVLVLIYLVGYFGGVFGLLLMADQQQQAGQRPDEMFGVYLFTWIIGWSLAFILVSALLQVPFMFVFPLIVDRELTGVEAVRLSFRAAFANLGGVMLIIFLEFLLSFVGVFACYVGAIFVMPVSYAMITIAYQQVFPPLDPYENMPLEPEPPAPVLLADSTAVKSKEPHVTSVQETPPQ